MSPLIQTTTSPSGNRSGRVRRWWIPPRVVRRIPVGHRRIRPETHPGHCPTHWNHRVEPIAPVPDAHRQRKILSAAVGVSHSEAHRKWYRRHPMQGDASELLPIHCLHCHAVDADVQYVGGVEEAAPEPREIFTGPVFDAAKEVARCGMLERPGSYVVTKRSVKSVGADDVIPES